MNFSSDMVNTSEISTRKQWLLSSLCWLVLYPFAVCTIFFSLSIWIQMPDDVITAPLSRAVGGLISMPLIWYFAYKKLGTKLLIFWLVISPGIQLTNSIESLMATRSSWMIMYVAIDAGVFLWWYLMSLKVRKVNKTIRERKAQLGVS